MSFFDHFNFITEHKYFDRVVGVLALANPVALLPALLAIHRSENAEGQSIMMWVIFLIIQIVFTMVGAKARNHGAFWSMAVSACLSLAGIVMLLTK